MIAQEKLVYPISLSHFRVSVNVQIYEICCVRIKDVTNETLEKYYIDKTCKFTLILKWDRDIW